MGKQPDKTYLMDERYKISTGGCMQEDEKGVSSIDTPGGIQEMTVVSEPGLYTLVLGSRKPEDVAFHGE